MPGFAASAREFKAAPSSLAVISTMGITRSYAMRVGPITPKHADDLLIQGVRGSDDAAIIQDGIAGLLSDEDLNAFSR